MRYINKTKLAMSALAATLLSANAGALMVDNPDAPKQVWDTKTMCLDAYGSDGQVTVYSFCDQSDNNKKNKRPLKENGCTEGQVAIKETINKTAKEKFKIKIKMCSVENDSAIEPMQL
jgi:hypothetical protein